MKLCARRIIEQRVSQRALTADIAPATGVTSIITRSACETLHFAEGREGYIVIKASNVITGVD